MTTTEAIRSRLQLQGFDCDSDPRVLAGARWLRFTPTLSTVCIIAGTALRSPIVLWSFALVTMVGAAGWHLFDALFNVFVRRWAQAPPLGPNPAPRRFAMAVAAVWSATASGLMSAGFVRTGVVAGGALAVAGAIVATTHFCLGSWMYRRLRRQKVAA
ncbi:MAG TPA: DUF4395 family protein [Gemmatimonadales bacterium]|nr:DUF4395 family protein [Gemmatimonadales bacterium]